MKRIGKLALATLLGVAVWYAGPGLRGTPHLAFAQAILPNCLEESLVLSATITDPACYDAYKLSYFDVATAFIKSNGNYGGPGNSGGSGDALLRIVNAGNFATTDASANDPPVSGDVCANIYVFNDTQELMECCSCPLTPNSLMTFSVINDLLSNPGNPKESLSAGVIKIVGSRGACINSPTATTAAGAYIVAGGLHEWINHTESMYSNLGPIVTSTSVDEFTNSTLDAGELYNLQIRCLIINLANLAESEDIGICSCGKGD